MSTFSLEVTPIVAAEPKKQTKQTPGDIIPWCPFCCEKHFRETGEMFQPRMNSRFFGEGRYLEVRVVKSPEDCGVVRRHAICEVHHMLYRAHVLPEVKFYRD